MSDLSIIIDGRARAGEFAAMLARRPGPAAEAPAPVLEWFPRSGGASIPIAHAREYLRRLTWQFAGGDE